MAKRTKSAPLDAAKLLAQIQAENPPPPMDIEELQRAGQRARRTLFRREPFQLIQEFATCFTYKSGRANLAVRPDDSIIELLAERFREYLTGAGPLDEAFGLKKQGGGRGSARERERLRLEKFAARMIYDALREEQMPQKRAVEAVARRLNCSESKVRTLLFR